MNSFNNKKEQLIFDISIQDDNYSFDCCIDEALKQAERKKELLDEQLSENLETLKKLTPECDKLDYALATSIGAIAGVIDIFLVGKPGESPLGDITDEWFANKTKSFAKLCGWDSSTDDSLTSAIKHLEKRFKIPYDQVSAGPAALEVFDFKLSTFNHHFKSLGHNASILGLFFSILDQFTNTSHFLDRGEMFILQGADNSFELKGNSVPSKLFCGFINWLGHLISDMSGSSGSKGRGMGIPSPLWSWINDVIVVKKKLNIPISDFDKKVSNLSLIIFEEGYDIRFQTAQAIPVLINELLVRSIYSIRRLVSYYTNTSKEERSFSLLWEKCEPFSNATVKRMLTVSHGTFCLMDVGDAVIRGFATGGGTFNVVECIMRLNIVGLGRFAISLYGEGKRFSRRIDVKENIFFIKGEKTITEAYIEDLQYLANKYDDKDYLLFVDDLNSADLYKKAFEKTVKLAKLRGVPEEKLYCNKEALDKYFLGE